MSRAAALMTPESWPSRLFGAYIYYIVYIYIYIYIYIDIDIDNNNKVFYTVREYIKNPHFYPPAPHLNKTPPPPSTGTGTDTNKCSNQARRWSGRHRQR